MKQFAEDVAEHRLTVLKDDGLYRHLRCAKPGSGVYAYEITTWPGYLAITGDMGDYVFHRTPDMFQLFRGAKFNPRYWQERCVAAGREGIGEFDGDALAANIWELFLEWLGEHWHHLTREQRRSVWDEIKSLTDSVKEDTDGQDSYRAVWEYKYVGGKHGCVLEFSDMSAYTRPTDYFVWCCHAIQWAIGQYDATEDGK